ncbi:UNVERIFIED_CONTAM: hypothetical protein K2H54_034778 [Gekko kuhli]
MSLLYVTHTPLAKHKPSIAHGIILACFLVRGGLSLKATYLKPVLPWNLPPPPKVLCFTMWDAAPFANHFVVHLCSNAPHAQESLTNRLLRNILCRARGENRLCSIEVNAPSKLWGPVSKNSAL